MASYGTFSAMDDDVDDDEICHRIINSHPAVFFACSAYVFSKLHNLSGLFICTSNFDVELNAHHNSPILILNVYLSSRLFLGSIIFCTDIVRKHCNSNSKISKRDLILGSPHLTANRKYSRAFQLLNEVVKNCYLK